MTTSSQPPQASTAERAESTASQSAPASHGSAEGLMSQSLAASPISSAAGPQVCEEKLRQAGLSVELASHLRTLAARGTVLLRNEAISDGAPVLPLQPTEPVALFGRVQKDWIAVGYGSGGDVKAPYVTNLLDSMREVGAVVDEELAGLYEAWCAANPVDPGTQWGQWPLSFAEMAIDDADVAAAASRASTAVVVIGRAAGEDRESLLQPGSYYLTEDEKKLLTQVRAAFRRVVAVVVTGNVMDLSWAEDYQIDALLLAWCGGMEGGRALAQVLVGQDEPGGRLTDTIAYHYEDYPSSKNFGDPQSNTYQEDIFVGYRYFETFAPEAVQFPFGFGLSYSTHDIAGRGLERTEDGVTITVMVTNTGNRASSTVTQVYVAKPNGPLSQPARELVAFARTDALAPGEAEEQELDIAWRELASYDDCGATGHRFAWVLPAGRYTFYAGADVRSAREIGFLDLADTFVIEQLEQAGAPDPAHPFERMARTIADNATNQLTWEQVPCSEVDLRERILNRLPEALTVSRQSEASDGVGNQFADVVAGKASLDDFVAGLSAKDLSCLAYGDIVMDSLLGVAGNAGAIGGVTPDLRERGIPAAITTDGPSGLRLAATASLMPCGTALASTWDPEAVELAATMHGQEMSALGSDILLGPGMNIHRDPLCGRNFEYFSEDPLLTGTMGGAVVLGVQASGKAACPKHFAANNQETNRIYADSVMSERALREIYLRGFEIVVLEAAPKTIMTSYNKVNGVWAHYHYDLVTTILRGEWGYEGLVMTDWWMRMAPDPIFPALRDSAYRIRGGIDVLMPGGDVHFSTSRDDAIMDSYGRDGGITLGEMQQTAIHVLRFLVGQERAGALAHRPRPAGSAQTIG